MSGDAQLLRLDAGNTSLLFARRGEDIGVVYLGTRLQSTPGADEALGLCLPPVPHGELDARPFDPLLATEDGLPRISPALSLRRDRASLPLRLRLCDSAQDKERIDLRFEDVNAGVRVEQCYRAHGSGVLSCATRLYNVGADSLEIVWLASLALPLAAQLCEVQSSGGFWANEFQSRRALIGDHSLVYHNARGRGSHQSWPCLAVGSRHFSEEAGEILQVALQWSGNHLLRIDRGRGGRQVIQCGIPERSGETRLAPREYMAAAPALFACSDGGLNGIRRQFRKYWDAHPEVRTSPARPVHFNSWEAAYFAHDEQSTRRLIDEAHALGAERFVLDDGWMRGRTGPGTGLGDWIPCPIRYPRGLGPVADCAREKGMEFGLWVEPEMVTRDSELAGAHPHWIITAPRGDGISGRGQWLLNLTLPEVRAYLEDRLERLVEDCAPAYLKWDMNRDYADTGLAAGATDRALVTSFYALIDRFRERHPAIAVELCASGGARSDAGALLRSERLWPSDSMDPLQRFRVLRTCSSLLPPPRLGWHIGSATSATSGATAPLTTRCILACLGHLGLELDPARLSADERERICEWVAFYRRERTWLAGAEYRFLDNPDPGRDSLLLVAEDRSRALLFLLQSEYPLGGTSCSLRIGGLRPDLQYTLRVLNAGDCAFVQEPPPWQRGESFQAGGEALARLGLQQPFLQVGHCALLLFEAL